ncbi:MAG: TonB-dependent receptor plug domain-containing protein, partial [Asticcacaulis sp.]
MSRSLSTRLTKALLAGSALATLFAAPAALAGTVVGSVVDQNNTKGLHGAEVSLIELGISAQATADGAFRFANVPAGTYTLRVRYAGAKEATQQVVVPQTGDVRANVSLAVANDAAGSVQEVLVIGQRANMLNAISRQRAADGVSTVITRDAIGQFPDQNVAESIRRAPGVNVLNDQGEGRFVSVRGLDPNLNSASINGNRILATGGDERAVAMDVIPSELIESIEIKKSLTPDMDGDTIGASIEINTTSALNRKKGFVSGSIEGSYNDLNEKTSPKASFDFATRITDNLGVAGGLSYYNREFSTDNVEAADWNDRGYAATLEYRDYDVTRERYGATLNFDYRLNDNTSLYLRTLYSKFDDTELRRRLVFKFDKAPNSVAGDKYTFDSADGRIEIRRDLKDRGEWQSVKTASIGGKTYFDA